MFLFEAEILLLNEVIYIKNKYSQFM